MRVSITNPEDPRIQAFMAMKERELARQGGRFIAEGEHLVRRLLASRYVTESVLLSERRAEEMENLVPEGIPIYVTSTEVMTQIIGFKFHSGVVACGLRGERRTLEEVLPEDSRQSDETGLRIVICEDINNNENLGSIIRVAAGFGVDAILLGERCTDPFFRRCVRVSMGTIFQLPLVQSENLLADLVKLRDRWNVQLAATVLALDGESLADSKPAPRMGILFGGEAQGLTAEAIAACDRRITIPMKLGTDSLNVAVAAGIFLYHFCGGSDASAHSTR